MKAVPEFHNDFSNNMRTSLYYQYRNFTSFWPIIESDSFWATNARFCNDEEEQRFGEHVIDALYRVDEESALENKPRLDENYIVCFCQDDDKLSQWRGYAPEGGVSMGFDFGAPRVFSVMHNHSNSIEKTENCELQYVALGAVCYVEPRRNDEKDEDYINRCRQKIDVYSTFSNKYAVTLYQQEVQEKAPFIKHSGFSEECEYRLVFHNHDGKLNKCIRYREDEKSMIKYPYIVVKAALPEDMLGPCVVRVCIQPGKEKKLVDKLKLSCTMPIIILGCHCLPEYKVNVGDDFCFGCTIRRMENFYAWQQCRYNVSQNKVESNYCIHEQESSVIISQGENQEKIFESIYQCVQEFKAQEKMEIAVWCEGHLPLRSITIGPCQNQNSMAEAIKYYCQHKYWLRDVKINVSAIPFRKSL